MQVTNSRPPAGTLHPGAKQSASSVFTDSPGDRAVFAAEGI